MVLLPAPAGPSMATMSRLCASVAIHVSFLKKTPRKLTVWHGGADAYRTSRPVLFAKFPAMRRRSGDLEAPAILRRDRRRVRYEAGLPASADYRIGPFGSSQNSVDRDGPLDRFHGDWNYSLLPRS